MGTLAFGKYRLIAELGHGGMADVYLALQEGPAGSGFRKLSVIKRLRQNLADQPEFIAMLVDEARITARLNHPNVVQTNEVGVVDDTYFIAMEFLEGQPLHLLQKRSAQRAKKDGTPPVLTADHHYLILMDAAAGIGHAHDLNDYDGSPLQIVHRDVTPQNIFVTYEGQVKVVDFGIAKAVGRASETRQGIVKGKVRYMAPEQAIGLAVTRQADLFAIGVMLWEAALGRRMWKDMDDLEILQSLVAGILPEMPRQIDPSVPEEIDRICRKALAVQVQDRYATADELRADLEQYLVTTGKLVQIRRELGSVVTDLFKETRAQVRAIIEKQLEAPDVPVQEATALLPIGPMPDSGAANQPPPSAVMHTAAPAVPSGSSQLPDGVAISDPLNEPPRNRRLVPAVVLGIFALLAVAGVALGAAALTKKEAAAAAAAASAQEVAVRVTSTTPHAFVRIDDKAAQALPIDMRVPRDSASHRLIVEAGGYQTRTETVSFAQDVQLALDLEPSGEPTPDTSAASPAPGTSAIASAPRPAHPRGPVVWRRSSPAPAAAPAPAPAPAPVSPPSQPPKKNDPKNQSQKGLSLDNADPWKHN